MRVLRILSFIKNGESILFYTVCNGSSSSSLISRVRHETNHIEALEMNNQKIQNLVAAGVIYFFLSVSKCKYEF